MGPARRAHGRGAEPPRPDPRARRGPAGHGGAQARGPGAADRRTAARPGRRGRPRPRAERARRGGRPRPPAAGPGRALADPPGAARAFGPELDAPGVRDRDQGDRPAGADGARRQGRDVRWRRRRQDGADHGADPLHGGDLRRHLGVRRYRRALARGARAAARDAGLGRARPHRAGVRPDERAAGRPLAGRADGADHRRIFPRRAGPQRPAADGQRVPLRPGRQRGLGPARPPAVAGRLPAHARDRDRRAAAAHRLGRAAPR